MEYINSMNDRVAKPSMHSVLDGLATTFDGIAGAVRRLPMAGSVHDHWTTAAAQLRSISASCSDVFDRMPCAKSVIPVHVLDKAYEEATDYFPAQSCVGAAIRQTVMLCQKLREDVDVDYETISQIDILNDFFALNYRAPVMRAPIPDYEILVAAAQRQC